MNNLEKGIYGLLQSLVGGSVFNLAAPANKDAPFIVYQRSGGSRWRSLNGPSGIAEVTLQVDCYADDSHAMRDLATEVEKILDGFAGLASYETDGACNIASCSLQEEFDSIEQTEEPRLFRNTSFYLIAYHQQTQEES